MAASEQLQARLIGALFVERGLVSESQIRVALEIQRETGQQLGQVLVERFGVSRRELASVVAEQWAKLGGSSGPEDSVSWRRLGEIFVERGFVTEDELEQALTRQRQTGERLGEALVAQGVISKFELAGALAEQMAMLEDTTAEGAPSEQPEATVHHLPTRALDPAEIPFGTVADGDPMDEPSHAVPDDDEHVADGMGEIGAEPEPEPEAAGAEVAEVPLQAEAIARGIRESDDRAEATEELADVVPDAVDEIDVTPEPVEAIAIDDVGHVSLVGASPQVEPEPAEAEPEFSEAEPEFAKAAPEPTEADPEVAEPEPTETAPELAEAAPEFAESVPVALFDDLRDALLADVSSVDEAQVEQLPSVACLAFAPTTDGYRLVGLESLPGPGDTIDVPDVGERLVLRVGRSPIPGDPRPCAYVEEPVTPAPVAALAH